MEATKNNRYTPFIRAFWGPTSGDRYSEFEEGGNKTKGGKCPID
jgi:hypothetical protein